MDNKLATISKSLMEYVFTYGMFRDVGKNIIGRDAKYCGKASVRGKIYKVNEFYPGFVPGDGIVWGDVYLVNPDNLSEMDIWEGDEYTRTKITTTNDIECWIYQYQLDVSNFEQIKCGDWILR